MFGNIQKGISKIVKKIKIKELGNKELDPKIAELTELLINSGADVNTIKSKVPIVQEAIGNTQNFTPDELALVFGLVTPSEIQGEVQ